MANQTKTYDKDGNLVIVETNLDAVKDTQSGKTAKTLINELKTATEDISKHDGATWIAGHVYVGGEFVLEANSDLNVGDTFDEINEKIANISVNDDGDTKIEGNVEIETDLNVGGDIDATGQISENGVHILGKVNTIEGNLNSEISRAKAAEKTTSDSLSSEITRAKAAEQANATAIAAEKTRAEGVEGAIKRDFGQYADLPSVTLTTEQTGKYINEKGEIVTATNWAIGKLGAVVVGNTYELNMGSSAKMVLGVALFVAREITTTASGQTKTEYIPLFSAKSTDIPSSGYVCFEAMEAYEDVLVCYRTDVSGANTLLVRRYGTKASIATQINNLKKKVDLKSFADGYYQGMAVGAADNFTSRGEASEDEQIVSRVSGGENAIVEGNATLESIKGNSVVWNQLFDNTTIRNGSSAIIAKVDGEISTTASNIYLCTKKSTLTEAHQYLLILNCKDSSVPSLKIYANISFTKALKTISYPTIGAYMHVEYFFTAPSGCDYLMMGYGSATSHTMTIKDDLQLFDLTAIFGSGNEPTSVAEFKALFPNSYYPYSEPKVINMTAEGLTSEGANLWDEQWENGALSTTDGSNYNANTKRIRSKNYIEICGGWSYYISTNLRACFYDKDKKFISVSSSNLSVVVAPSNANYMRFYTANDGDGVYHNDICINVSNASINGEYFPHVAPFTRSWDDVSKKYFPSGLARVGSVYDELTNTKAIQRVGVVDLGTLTWTLTSRYFKATFTLYKEGTNSRNIQNCLCSKYSVLSPYNIYNGSEGISTGSSGVDTKCIICKDSNYTDADAFKTAMNGVLLYYELATESVTEFDEINLGYKVYPNGLEYINPVQASAEIPSAPLIANIVYDIDYPSTIKNNKAAIEAEVTRAKGVEAVKANVDGVYPYMRVGTADNLTARGTATSEQFALRVAGGSNTIEDGDAEIKSIKGNTLVWNQRFKNGATNKSALTWNGCVGTINGTFDTATNIYNTSAYGAVFYAAEVGHKVLVSMHKISGSGTAKLYSNGMSGGGYAFDDFECVGVVTSGTYFCYFILEGEYADYKFFVNYFDLTQMFGAGNEPTSVAEFRKLFPKAYYEYSEPKLLDMKASGVKTSGRNLWDEVWVNGLMRDGVVTKGNYNSLCSVNLIPIIGGKTYYFRVPYAVGSYGWNVAFYNGNKELIIQKGSYSTTIDAPSNAKYMRFQTQNAYGGAYKNDVCINYYDASFNGTYEPYETRTRSWSSTMSQYFPNGLKSAGAVYDEITSTKVIKRIGSVDLGTLTWTLKTNEYFYAKYKNDTYSTKNTMLAGYTKAATLTNVSNTNMSYSCNGGAGYYIAIRNDAYTDAATFKATLNGVILYYQLATAEETEIDELNLTERVAKGGMEEAIVAEDTESSPLKIDVVYPIDALGTILSNKAAIADLITRVTALENK